jgi:TonB family protein
MNRLIAAIGGILNASRRGVAQEHGDRFRRYLFISVMIHVVLIAALSISYSRSVKPVMQSAPYEVSLVEFEKPKPEKTAARPPVEKPEPKPVEKKEEEPPKEEPPEEVAKIKPTPKKEEEPEKIVEEPKEKAQKPEKKPEPERKTETDRPTAPDSLLAERREPKQAPGVGGFQVDSPNFNYNYYLDLLRDKIRQNWKPPSGMPTKGEYITAVVEFTVRRDGMIIGVRVEESSGLAFFDQSTLRAVLNSNPAPPLPRAFEEDRLGVHVNFVFGEGDL